MSVQLNPYVTKLQKVLAIRFSFDAPVGTRMMVVATFSTSIVSRSILLKAQERIFKEQKRRSGIWLEKDW